jgi:hypothetical protein
VDSKYLLERAYSACPKNDDKWVIGDKLKSQAESAVQKEPENTIGYTQLARNE